MKCYLLHVTREFYSIKIICRNLYAIFFTCEKSLYSQSEWRTAVFHESITNQRCKGLCEPIRIVHRLHSNNFSDLVAFLAAAPANFSSEGGGKL